MVYKIRARLFVFQSCSYDGRREGGRDALCLHPSACGHRHAGRRVPAGPGPGRGRRRGCRRQRPRSPRPLPGAAQPAQPDRRHGARRQGRPVRHPGPLQPDRPRRPEDTGHHRHRRRDRRRAAPGSRRHHHGPRRQPLRHRDPRPERHPPLPRRPAPQGGRLQPRGRRQRDQRDRLQRRGPALRHRPLLRRSLAPGRVVGGRPARGEAAHPPRPSPAHAGGLRLRPRRPGLRPPDVRRAHRCHRRRCPYGPKAGGRVRLHRRPQG